MNKISPPKSIQILTEKIVSLIQPDKIILFGSWAWGKPDPDSDVDILVVKDSEKPRQERERELRMRLWPAGVPFDLLVYTSEELSQSIDQHKNLFLKDILNNGIVLYANDQIRSGLGSSR